MTLVTSQGALDDRPARAVRRHLRRRPAASRDHRRPHDRQLGPGAVPGLPPGRVPHRRRHHPPGDGPEPHGRVAARGLGVPGLGRAAARPRRRPRAAPPPLDGGRGPRQLRRLHLLLVVHPLRRHAVRPQRALPRGPRHRRRHRGGARGRGHRRRHRHPRAAPPQRRLEGPGAGLRLAHPPRRHHRRHPRRRLPRRPPPTAATPTAPPTARTTSASGS